MSRLTSMVTQYPRTCVYLVVVVTLTFLLQLAEVAMHR